MARIIIIIIFLTCVAAPAFDSRCGKGRRLSQTPRRVQRGREGRQAGRGLTKSSSVTPVLFPSFNSAMMFINVVLRGLGAAWGRKGVGSGGRIGRNREMPREFAGSVGEFRHTFGLAN
jgi:hypothetical protein